MTKIEFINDGPAVVSTDSGIMYSEMGKDNITAHDKTYIAICRCGKAQDGLFCDGSHRPNE